MEKNPCIEKLLSLKKLLALKHCLHCTITCIEKTISIEKKIHTQNVAFKIIFTLHQNAF
jgi:hypothetical protein